MFSPRLVRLERIALPLLAARREELHIFFVLNVKKKKVLDGLLSGLVCCEVSWH